MGELNLSETCQCQLAHGDFLDHDAFCLFFFRGHSGQFPDVQLLRHIPFLPSAKDPLLLLDDIDLHSCLDPVVDLDQKAVRLQIIQMGLQRILGIHFLFR